MRGVIEKIIDDYGFIGLRHTVNGENSIFFHMSQCQTQVSEGDLIEFYLDNNRRHPEKLIAMGIKTVAPAANPKLATVPREELQKVLDIVEGLDDIDEAEAAAIDRLKNA